MREISLALMPDKTSRCGRPGHRASFMCFNQLWTLMGFMLSIKQFNVKHIEEDTDKLAPMCCLNKNLIKTTNKQYCNAELH